MARLNALLVLLAVASALGVVAAQHQSRKLFQQTRHEEDREHALEVEWGQLQLEQSTWAAHVRIEKIARSQLRMQPPATDHLLTLEPAP